MAIGQQVAAASRVFFARLIELPSRLTKFEKTPGVILNGEENDYPNRVRLLIENSITAHQCRDLLKKYLMGKGFGEAVNGVEVGEKGDGYTALEMLADICEEFAEQKGIAVHVAYKLEGTQVVASHYTVVPFDHVRKGKKDSKDYVGMYGLHEDWPQAKKKDIVWVNAFNPSQDILMKQIQAAGGVESYKGQLLFVNPSRYDYPLAHIHPVMNDCDSEFRSGVFKNKSLRKGFFGKNILITPPLIETAFTQVPKEELTDVERRRLKEMEDHRAKTVNALKGFVGVENNEGFLHLEVEHAADDIDKAIKNIRIESDINDKMFEYTENSSSNNIRKAFYNVPLILIDTTDHSLFGDSAAKFTEAKQFYWEQTEEARMLILNAVSMLFAQHPKLRTVDLEVESLIEEAPLSTPAPEPTDDVN